jgi:hypothetical protein
MPFSSSVVSPTEALASPKSIAVSGDLDPDVQPLGAKRRQLLGDLWRTSYRTSPRPTSATRRSPAADSFGTPTVIGPSSSVTFPGQRRHTGQLLVQRRERGVVAVACALREQDGAASADQPRLVAGTALSCCGRHQSDARALVPTRLATT